MAHKKGSFPSGHFETAFVVEGFQNWKKGVERFRSHETSDLHKEVMLKHKSLQAPSIVDQLSISASREHAQNREMLSRSCQAFNFY